MSVPKTFVEKMARISIKMIKAFYPKIDFSAKL